MADATIPDPRFTFDEALILDASIKMAADLDDRFRADAVLNSAREKLWRSAMRLHGNHPEVYTDAIERFRMRQRLTKDPLDGPDT